ncbi:MAG: winged helix-turn-helix domain-containing protein [Pseudobdellovibrio sp.]
MNADRIYELSKLYCDRGDYDLALPNLIDASNAYLADKNFEMYLKSVQLILRIYAEKEEYEQLSAYKEKLHDIVIRENIQLTSRVYYVFGIAAVYKGQVENGLEYFKIALDHALKSDNKEDICYAILGIAVSYRHAKRYEEALKEIYNLNIFMQFIDNLDIKVAVLSANANILYDLKKYNQALDVFWQAYETTKASKNMSVSMSILGNIGICLYELGQKEAAKIYFDLVLKSLDLNNGKKMLLRLKPYIDSYIYQETEGFDLSFDFDNHIVKEKQLGQIDFKNQFILLDLLKLFISKQGEVFSKEFLVEQIWKQDYNPEVHDNKIYVTIKRLRKMIEPDYDRPKYIFRSKNGYFLNKSIKINNQITQEGRI